ncbi:Gfo/Idh/MocA family protein [Lachnobacterium bovis]|uniref:Predicted dehydrogenase n=1 Tax=Lachnobacterium bovis TaxID=140626 RepID=A0A1H9PXB8_9FIRM|nr:Gfo/Idh/MocA family oxidoreductase [Lachnobacterium bovis]SER52871.1 Predicted dehydrogenase [Lachnobacterium bovis]
MNLAIIGTGKIVSESLYAIQSIENINLKAIYARKHSEEKGISFAKKYSIDTVYTDYDELLNNSEIDTVYIGLINSVHYEYAKKALENNKHVILEKPFTGTYEQACELVDIAINKKLFILEAITVLHSQIFKEMKSNLHKLGKIKAMLCNYSQYSSRYDNYLKGIVEPAFNPDLYGGALLDINIYNIHYCVGLLGQPRKSTYFANRGFNGVDTSGTIVLEYDGFSAVCTGAKDSDSPSFISIQGENGYMCIQGKPNVPQKLTMVLVDKNSIPQKDAAGALKRAINTIEFESDTKKHRMVDEFKNFVDIIDNNRSKEAKKLMDESLEVMKVVG